MFDSHTKQQDRDLKILIPRVKTDAFNFVNFSPYIFGS
jgi:hypothetical protein